MSTTSVVGRGKLRIARELRLQALSYHLQQVADMWRTSAASRGLRRTRSFNTHDFPALSHICTYRTSVSPRRGDDSATVSLTLHAAGIHMSLIATLNGKSRDTSRGKRRHHLIPMDLEVALSRRWE